MLLFGTNCRSVMTTPASRLLGTFANGAVRVMIGHDDWAEGARPPISQVIKECVVARSADWFPDVGPSPNVQIGELSSRPRCSLYVVRLGDGGGAPQILAKVRRAEPAPSSPSEPQLGVRPRLRTESATPDELATLEYDGLRSIFTGFGPSHPTFGVIRPLEHLSAASTILMDYVPGRTLRESFIAESRLMFAGRSARRRRPEGAWRNAGAWLRNFHDVSPQSSLPAHQSTRRDIIDQFEAYDDFLTNRLGSRAFGDIANRGAALAASVLPDELPLAVGHGDYAPRNMFVDVSGRITVFDPMPRWRVPCIEDLCRFLVGLRLLGLQLHSHGAAYSQQELERREREVISGYFAGNHAALAQVRCYQLLIMLDKWSALLDAPTSGRAWRARLRTTSVELASGYLRREARRLLDLAEPGRA